MEERKAKGGGLLEAGEPKDGRVLEDRKGK